MLRLRSLVVFVALASAAVLAGGCQSVDLSKDLTVTPVLSGYYDMGLLDGWSHLVPDIIFKVKDTGADSVPAGVPITVSFWFNGDTDGENDSIVLPGLASTLAPGQETGELQARAPHGFRLEGARQDFFAHSGFKDMTAKVFVARRGTIYRLGEFPISRQIIPHASATPGHP
jgi:hypothetical protein